MRKSWIYTMAFGFKNIIVLYKNIIVYYNIRKFNILEFIIYPFICFCNITILDAKFVFLLFFFNKICNLVETNKIKWIILKKNKLPWIAIGYFHSNTHFISFQSSCSFAATLFLFFPKYLEYHFHCLQKSALSTNMNDYTHCTLFISVKYVWFPLRWEHFKK